jgi:hypothetical protein
MDLIRERADDIHRMSYVRSCLLDYADEPIDETARAVVLAIATQVLSLTRSAEREALIGAIEQEFWRLEDLPAAIRRMQDEIRAARASSAAPAQMMALNALDVLRAVDMKFDERASAADIILRMGEAGLFVVRAALSAAHRAGCGNARTAPMSADSVSSGRHSCEQGSQIAGSASSDSAPRAGEAGLQAIFREPALLKMAGEEWEFDDDTAVKWAWFSHGQHTGMTPYFSVQQLRAAFNAGAAQDGAMPHYGPSISMWIADLLHILTPYVQNGLPLPEGDRAIAQRCMAELRKALAEPPASGTDTPPLATVSPLKFVRAS